MPFCWRFPKVRKPIPVHTPDGRYFVIVGRTGARLWRATNPALPLLERERLTKELMGARRAVRLARSDQELHVARAQVNSAQIALGERGPVWWTDGAADLNRRLLTRTPYAEWWSELSSSQIEH